MKYSRFIGFVAIIFVAGCDQSPPKSPPPIPKPTAEEAAANTAAQERAQFEYKLESEGDALISGRLSDWARSSSGPRGFAAARMLARANPQSSMSIADLVACIDEVSKEDAAGNQAVSGIAAVCIVSAP